MKPADMKILVVGENYWGKADTLKEALAKMRSVGGSHVVKRYIAYVVHPDSRVDSVYGSISYPDGFPPKEIHRVGIPLKKEKK